MGFSPLDSGRLDAVLLQIVQIEGPQHCSVAVVGRATLRVRKRATAQGLIVSPELPSSISGHSWFTTERP